MTDTTPEIPDFAVQYKQLPIVTLTRYHPIRVIDLAKYTDFSEDPEEVYYSIENRPPEGVGQIRIRLEGSVLTLIASPQALANQLKTEIDIEVETHIEGESHSDYAMLLVRTADEESGIIVRDYENTYTNGWRIRLNRDYVDEFPITVSNPAVGENNTVYFNGTSSLLWLDLSFLWRHPVVTPDASTAEGGAPLNLPPSAEPSQPAPFTVSYSVVSNTMPGYQFFIVPGTVKRTGGTVNPYTMFLFGTGPLTDALYLESSTAVVRITVTYNGTTQTQDVTLRVRTLPIYRRSLQSYNHYLSWSVPNFERSYNYDGKHFYEIGHNPLGPDPLLSSDLAEQTEPYISFGKVRRRFRSDVVLALRRAIRQDGFWMIRHEYTHRYFGILAGGNDTPKGLQNDGSVQNATMQIIYGGQGSIESTEPLRNRYMEERPPYLPSSTNETYPADLNSISINFKGTEYLNSYVRGHPSFVPAYARFTWGAYGYWITSGAYGSGVMAELYEQGPSSGAEVGVTGQLRGLNELDGNLIYQTQMIAPIGTQMAPTNNNYLPQYRAVGEGVERNTSLPVYSPVSKEDFSSIKWTDPSTGTEYTAVSDFSLGS